MSSFAGVWLATAILVAIIGAACWHLRERGEKP